jgi:hypothetical protein
MRGAALGAVWLSLVGTTACGSSLVQLPPVQHTPQTNEEAARLAREHPDLARLTVALGKVDDLGTWDCTEGLFLIKGVRGSFRARLEENLVHRGFNVVSDPSTAQVVLTEEAMQPGGCPHEVSLSVQAGGGTLESVSASSYTSSFSDAAMNELVDKVVALHKLAVFAAHPSQPPAAVAVASVAADAPAAAPGTPASPTPTAAPTPAASPVATAFNAGAPQPNAYALVVGVEKYSNGLPPPTGAHADADRFSNLVRSSLGVPPDHVQLVLDEQAGKAGIERGLEWVRSSVPAGGRIYFYFSGHGAPDASGGASYIVPADGDPKYLDATAIAMKDVLTKLGQSKAREVLAVVDSCFSGAGGRSVLPPGARPLVRVREELAPAQLALFSASSGNEISGPVAAGNGGLFTKYVLDGLGSGAADVNGDGQVSLSELSQWVTPRVAREAKKDNRDQNPALTVGKGLGSADGFIVEWGLASK